MDSLQNQKAQCPENSVPTGLVIEGQDSLKETLNDALHDGKVDYTTCKPGKGEAIVVTGYTNFRYTLWLLPRLLTST